MRRNSGFITFLQPAFTGNMIIIVSSITTKCCTIHNSAYQWSTIYFGKEDIGANCTELKKFSQLLLSFITRKCKLSLCPFMSFSHSLSFSLTHFSLIFLSSSFSLILASNGPCLFQSFRYNQT